MKKPLMCKILQFLPQHHGHMSATFLPILLDNQRILAVYNKCNKCKTITVIGHADAREADEGDMLDFHKLQGKLEKDGWETVGF